jgi:hypothetical protein
VRSTCGDAGDSESACGTAMAIVSVNPAKEYLYSRMHNQSRL